MSKHKALECLIKEIKILSDCDHVNVAKIIKASLNGVLTREYLPEGGKEGAAQQYMTHSGETALTKPGEGSSAVGMLHGESTIR